MGPGEVHSLMPRPCGRGTIPVKDHAHSGLLTNLEGESDPGHHAYHRSKGRHRPDEAPLEIRPMDVGFLAPGGAGSPGEILPEVFTWRPAEKEEGSSIPDGVGDDIPCAIRSAPKRERGTDGGPLLAQRPIESSSDVALPEEVLQALLGGPGPDKSSEDLQEILTVEVSYQEGRGASGLLRP